MTKNSSVTLNDILDAVLDLSIATSQIGIILSTYMQKDEKKDDEALKSLAKNVDSSLNVARKLLEKMK